MNVKNVIYQKVFSLGNYENEKIGIEIELSENENPIDALFEAKKYVEKAHLFNKRYYEYERAKSIVKDDDNYTGKQRKQAEEFISDFEFNFNDFISKANSLKSLPKNLEVEY